MNYFSNCSSNLSKTKLSKCKLITLKKIRDATQKEITNINNEMPKLRQNIEKVHIKYAPEFHGDVLSPGLTQERNNELNTLTREIKKIPDKKRKFEERLKTINTLIEQKEKEEKTTKRILTSKLKTRFNNQFGPDVAQHISSFMGKSPSSSKSSKSKSNCNDQGCAISGGTKTRKYRNKNKHNKTKSL